MQETSPAILTYNPSGPPLSVPIFDNGLNGKPESYTPPDRETTWGIGVGSRILRNKLFWFAALDSNKRNNPGVAMVKHPYLCAAYGPDGQCTEPTGFFANPSDCEMQVLSARLGLAVLGQPKDCTSGLILGLTAYSPMLESLAGLLGPAPRTATQWTGFGRLDWKTSERQSFTLEGIGARWNSPGGGLTGLSENYGNHSFGSSKASEEWLLGRWERFLTPNLLAVTQASSGRVLQEARPETPSTYEQTFLNGNVGLSGIVNQLPQIVVDNRYGFTIGNPSRFGQGSYPDEHLYHGQESLDWIRGKLLVKAGFEVSHNSRRDQPAAQPDRDVYLLQRGKLHLRRTGLREQFGLTTRWTLNQHNCDQTGKVWTRFGGQSARAGQPALLLLLLADHGPRQVGI